MATAIKVSDKLAEDARRIAQMEKRSLSGQVEYWAMIGKAATENPDLSFDLIRELMLAVAEAEDGLVTDYEFNA